MDLSPGYFHLSLRDTGSTTPPTPSTCACIASPACSDSPLIMPGAQIVTRTAHVCAVLLLAASAAAGDAYPLWDHQESVAAYARRVNLPPADMLDLAGGVKLELVLIPAGEVVMGTPAPGGGHDSPI